MCESCALNALGVSTAKVSMRLVSFALELATCFGVALTLAAAVASALAVAGAACEAAIEMCLPSASACFGRRACATIEWLCV